MEINTRLQDDLHPDWSSDSGRLEPEPSESPPTRARAALRIPRPTSRIAKPSPALQKSSLRTLRILSDLLGD